MPEIIKVPGPRYYSLYFRPAWRSKAKARLVASRVTLEASLAVTEKFFKRYRMTTHGCTTTLSPNKGQKI